MATPQASSIAICKATSADAPRWLQLLQRALGTDYVARQIYDPVWAAQQLDGSHGEETWIAEVAGEIRGSISLLLPFTPNDNPVANLGRHLTTPDSCRDGSAEALLRKVHELCVQRRQMAILRVPASDQAQQALLEKLGFVCVGFQPAKHLYRLREGVLFYVRIGAPAPSVRLTLSHSLPQIVELAAAVLQNLSIPNPDLVRDGATGYPVQSELHIEESTPAAFEAAQLQAQRTNVPVEISGQFNRGLGMFRLAGDAPLRTFLGSREGQIAAGLSAYFDEYDRCLRLVDCFALDERSTGVMLQHAVKFAQDTLKALYLEVDFLITAPRALKCAEQLGFVPVAFLPGTYKRSGCRVDVVKMVKLNTEYSLDLTSFTPHAKTIVSIVDRNFQDQKVGVSTINLLRGLSAFEGLGDGELGKMARLFEKKLFRAGEKVFNQNDPGETAFIVMRGQIDIQLADAPEPVATLGSGAIFGEQAFLEGSPRTAVATATQPAILLVVKRPAFNALIQTEPQLGMFVMRNIALELSRRLRTSNQARGADNQ